MKNLTSEILNKKYFIFDIDGTLIDSMGMWNLVDQMVIKKHTGVDVDAMEIKDFRDSVLYNASNLHGDIYMIYYQELVKFLGLDITAEQYGEERREFSTIYSINNLDYKPGADRLLHLLKLLGKKIGIASTTIRKQYDIYENQNVNILKKAPLKDFIDAKVLCEDVSKKKPDPEAYLKALELLGANPEDSVVFEDSLNGVISAKEAGIDVVAIYDDSAKNEQELIEKITDYKVDSFDEFIKLTGLEIIQHKQM